jgi:hypothetical protein
VDGVADAPAVLLQLRKEWLDLGAALGLSSGGERGEELAELLVDVKAVPGESCEGLPRLAAVAAGCLGIAFLVGDLCENLERGPDLRGGI